MFCRSRVTRRAMVGLLNRAVVQAGAVVQAQAEVVIQVQTGKEVDTTKGEAELNITLNALRPRQNGRHFADDTFKRIFMNENVRIFINISLKFVPKGLINNIPALVQIMAWCRPGDKPLSEPMMVNLLTHICVTRPQ